MRVPRRRIATGSAVAVTSASTRACLRAASRSGTRARRTTPRAAPGRSAAASGSARLPPALPLLPPVLLLLPPVPSYYGYYDRATTRSPRRPPAPASSPSRRRRAAELPQVRHRSVRGRRVSVEDQRRVERHRPARPLPPDHRASSSRASSARPSYDESTSASTAASARRCVYEIGAYNRLAPYVLAGLGVQQADVGGAVHDHAELRRARRRPALRGDPERSTSPFDIRAGSRATRLERRRPTTRSAARRARTIAPPSASSDESEEYTRARLSAILYF